MEPALIRDSYVEQEKVEEVPIQPKKEKFSFRKIKNRIVSRVRFQYMQLKWRIRNEQTSPEEWGLQEVNPPTTVSEPALESLPAEPVQGTSDDVKDIDFTEVEEEEPAPKKWVDDIDISKFVDWEEKHKGAEVEVSITRSTPGPTPPLGVNLPHFDGEKIYFLFFAKKMVDENTQELHKFTCLVPIKENADFLSELITSEEPEGIFVRRY